MVLSLLVAVVCPQLLGQGFVQVVDQQVDVNAVGICALFDTFKAGSGTTKATEAILKKNWDQLGIGVDDVLNAHVASNLHSAPP